MWDGAAVRAAAADSPSCGAQPERWNLDDKGVQLINDTLMVTRLQTKDDLTWQRQALDLGSGLRLGSLRFLRLRVLFVQGCFVRCSTQQPPSADRSGRGAHTTAVQREADTRTHTTQTEKTGKRRLKGRQGKGGSADALSWSSQSCAANVFSGLSLLGSAASAAVSGSTRVAGGRPTHLPAATAATRGRFAR